ncbi:phage tail protein (plasmid) [Nostoc sp. UHCC 0926]|uniref:phage tail protein n=1 Tax=Nostoc sp. UHCC 0926 TaxID=3025190 RepID=UPI00235E1AD3|nr:phage tail protein [Nostoc sp. UHCC 0926]WDD36381.1 phage tail protein [Nostoc sp. UHCC 0926]
MNPKEFKFLVLNPKTDWQKCKLDNLHFSDEGIKLKSGYQFVFESQIFGDQPFSQLEAVDLAVDDFGQLYLLNTKERRIWLFDSEQKYLEPLTYLDALFGKPTNIAFSNSTIYVADEFQVSEYIQSRIYAFSRFNWQIRWVVTLPQDVKVIDLAANTTDGTLYVLWDDREQVVAKYAPSGQRIEKIKFTNDDIVNPTAIALGVNGYIYVLDSQKSHEKVVRFDVNGTRVEHSLINFTRLREQLLVPKEIEPSGLAVDSQGNVYIGDKRSRSDSIGVSLSQGEEEDRFIFRCPPSGGTVEAILGYRGAVNKMICVRDRLFIFNSDKQTVNVLRREQQFLRQKYQELPTGSFKTVFDSTIPDQQKYQELPTGSFKTVFDSTIPDQQWHKFILEGEIPQNTQIKVYYSITDSKWQRAEPYFEPLINPSDALILGNKEIPSPKGRYLHLKVEFIGTEHQTPILKSLRVVFPRLSYLRYLPAVYQEDEKSRDFLERFLSLFETFLGKLEGEIDHIVRYFDADVVDEDFLPWLSTWLAIATDENFTQEQLRNLIRKAPQLYKQRGTREGIAATVELFTGDRPLIIEYFQLEESDTNEQVNEILKKEYFSDNEVFRFWILLSPFQVNSEIELQTIQRLIEADTPAYTEACIKLLQPWISLDKESYLGFNSCIFEPSLQLDMGAAISQENILTDIEEFGQLERRSRIGLDTKLN